MIEVWCRFSGSLSLSHDSWSFSGGFLWCLDSALFRRLFLLIPSNLSQTFFLNQYIFNRIFLFQTLGSPLFSFRLFFRMNRLYRLETSFATFSPPLLAASASIASSSALYEIAEIISGSSGMFYMMWCLLRSTSAMQWPGRIQSRIRLSHSGISAHRRG